jgi:hypothetical protein
MNRFNEYMSSNFRSGGCRLIARARDNCRNRDVTIHAMPGYWDVVGVTDGVDAWVAPASAGLFFGTATGDCADLMRRLQAGEPLPPVPETRSRKRVILDDPQPLTAVRRERAQLKEEQVSSKPRARL